MLSITKTLIENKDESNAAFQAKLAPTLDREAFLGIKVPKLREIEKQYRGSEEAEEFLNTLPHTYYDENLLHSVFIANMKNYDAVLDALDRFLPYVDNWAACDTLRPNVFKKKKDTLMEKIREWISSKETYTCRFGIDMLMTYYLDKDFKAEYLELPAAVHSEEYYVNMMIAWYYATALAKQWDATLPFITENRLDKWIHNKTIQKARESFRITDEQKELLASYR